MEYLTEILTGAAGLIIITAVVLKPKLFWLILILVLVGTAGLMIRGYCFTDEYLIGCLLLGALIVLAKRKEINFPKTHSAHRWIFLLMVVYLLIQSFYGLVLWQDWRITRWILYYAMLGMLLCIIPKKDFSLPQPKQIALIITGSALLYFSSYLVYGLFCENVRGISRFAMQGIEWSGSAYAVFPLVIAIPAAIILLKQHSRYQFLGWAALILMMVTGFYYDSRISCLSILAFILVSISIIKFKKVVMLLACFLVLFCLRYIDVSKPSWGKRVSRIKAEVRITSRSAIDLWAPRQIDLDRHLLPKASFAAVNANWKTRMFGYGVHSSHHIIGHYLQPLYAKYLPDVKLKKIVRTTGFPALLIDTGWVGILLLFLNFLFVAHWIFTHTRWRFKTYRYIFLSSLLIIFLWPLVSNIQDIMLFYFLIMPSGLIVQLMKKD